ncbi:MAG TPA: 23S rRNA (uracil(1939)-C(5))-methyltransferase RlmD [Candidatus Kapabacteria bacterium]|nr:23S rRNA (uracil(1939)-C(5))-methyltransferase RlmD [Candidatus Kapabacteria bacterium]
MPQDSLPERLPKPERGDRLELTTDSLAFEGKAVARREDGYVIFVEGAIAHERIIAEIKKAKGSFAEAKLVEILEPGPERRTPICPYFGICGGCALQHLTYEAQLRWKKQQVIDLFERVGKIPNPPVRDVLAAESEYYYRNKMEFSFSNERWLTEEEIASGDVQDRFALGLHVRERFDRVIDTEVCFLPNPVVADILNFTREFAIQKKLGVYHNGSSGLRERSGPSNTSTESTPTKPEEDGLLRFLVIKTSHATGEIMVNLVTSREEPDVLVAYARELVHNIPQVTTIVNNINSKRSQVAVGQYEIVYHGDGTIRDKIGGANYRISANSFFQANTPQAERLYEIAANFAELKSSDELWDLYCGTGTISLFVANRVRHVLGIELIESSIADARANAEANGISNADFIASDLRHALTKQDFLSEHANPTALIIDPPRSGMHPDVIREVLKLAPARIAYISCNPATQARDIALLAEGYELLELAPVDMFPQTYHIECVAKLRLKG